MTPGDVVRYRYERWTIQKVTADKIILAQYREAYPSIRTAEVERRDIPGLRLAGEWKLKTQEEK